MRRILLVTLIFVLSFVNVKAYEIPFEVEADYIYMMNIDSKEVIYEKNAYEKMYPASMTKIMTAIVALENIEDLDEKVIITSQMMAGLYEANASMAGFGSGDVVTYRDLLYGVMLPSGAECTQALAYSIFGNVETFVAKMNEKAQELKMNNTHFMNTTGLHDNNHYSTCYDLSLLLNYAIKNEVFYDIFTASQYVASNGLKMDSTTLKYIGKNSHLIGAKSGFTNKAQRCLASISDGDERYLMIVGHAKDDLKVSRALVESLDIYNYFYDNYHYETLYKKGDVIEDVKVKYSIQNYQYHIIAQEDIGLTTYNDYSVDVHIDNLEAPINKGDSLGYIKVFADDQEELHYDILASEDIDRNVFVYYLWPVIEFTLLYPKASFNIVIMIIIGGIVIKLIKGFRKRK